MDSPSRAIAIRRLERDRARILALLERLPEPDLLRPGVGGGEWSPKDLLSHLASWEEHALEALDAWARGEPAPIDRALRSRRLSDINAEAVRRDASLTWPEARRRAEQVREHLIAEIRAMPQERWAEPPTSRGRSPLGRRLGQILGGAEGPFAHDRAHEDELRSFVVERSVTGA